MVEKSLPKTTSGKEPSEHAVKINADELEMQELEKVSGGGLGDMPTDDPQPISDITRDKARRRP